MIIAFDLDRTLIFSKKAMEELNSRSFKQTCIEMKDGKEISFIRTSTLKTLRELNVFENVHFVPVTTRSYEQYKRLAIADEFEYVICANGGIILHNDRKLAFWNRHIENLMVDSKGMYEKVIKELENRKFITTQPKIVDNSFVFCKTNDVEKCTQFLQSFLFGTGYNFTIQGTKVYVMHKYVSKDNAVKNLSRLLEDDYLITMGDGKLDRKMVLLGNEGYVPAKSELLEYLSEDEKVSVNITRAGMHAFKALLKNVRERILSEEKYTILRGDIR